MGDDYSRVIFVRLQEAWMRAINLQRISFFLIAAVALSCSSAGMSVQDGANHDGGDRDDANSACPTGLYCPTGHCSNGSCVYGASCLAILKAGGSQDSGTYWIRVGEGAPFEVYCDMTTDGGGWTRVAGINPSDHAHVTSEAVNSVGMTTATAVGKFSDSIINALKSGTDPGFRLTCQNSSTPVTGYFSTSCVFSAAATPDAMGACTATSYVYEQPERYGGEYAQSCIVGVADGDHGTGERLIYGANANLCNNGTTGCDTQYAHWGGSGSLWVR